MLNPDLHTPLRRYCEPPLVHLRLLLANTNKNRQNADPALSPLASTASLVLISSVGEDEKGQGKFLLSFGVQEREVLMTLVVQDPLDAPHRRTRYRAGRGLRGAVELTTGCGLVIRGCFFILLLVPRCVFRIENPVIHPLSTLSFLHLFSICNLSFLPVSLSPLHSSASVSAFPLYPFVYSLPFLSSSRCKPQKTDHTSPFQQIRRRPSARTRRLSPVNLPRRASFASPGVASFHKLPVPGSYSPLDLAALRLHMQERSGYGN